MQLSNLTLHHTRQYMVDVHGKQYPIKQQRGRYYIQHATGQLTVTTVLKEADNNDWCCNYIFGGLFQTHPCPAIDFFIYRHRRGIKITTAQYKQKFNVKHK
jgi:hypothetical protein